jgi:hypothetical protein
VPAHCKRGWIDSGLLAELDENKNMEEKPEVHVPAIVPAYIDSSFIIQRNKSVV